MKNTKRKTLIRSAFSLALAGAMLYGSLPPLPVEAVSGTSPW